jgi:hypothetical protein
MASFLSCYAIVFPRQYIVYIELIIQIKSHYLLQCQDHAEWDINFQTQIKWVS